MKFPRRERAFPQGSPRRSPKATRSGAATGADENASPKHLVPVAAASPQRKKVLGERNDGGVGGMEGSASPAVQQPKPAPSPPTLAGRGAGPYDPKTNYTTPRPAFLRYDPERRREILLRVSSAADGMYEDCSNTTSGTAASEKDGDSLASDAAAASPVSSAPTSDSEAELDDNEEEEEELVPARRARCVRWLFLLLVSVSCYIYCSNPSSFPAYSEDALVLDRGISGMYDAYDHELDSMRYDHGLDSLRLSGPVDVMSPEELVENTNQIVHEDTESVDHLYDNRASPRHLVAVTVMGLADICLDVSLGELTCRVGSGRSENDDFADSREDSEMDKLDTEAAISFQNDNQTSEVDCLDGTILLDSINTTTTHTNEEEGSSESVHIEEGDDCSKQCVLQLVSVEKVIKSANDKIDAIKSTSDKIEDRKDLESEDLNLWQYENTADAAKTICSTVKFLWAAMKPHLLQILACLSFAGLVAVLYRCYQRPREPQDALPVHSSEQPMQLTIRNQGLPDSLEVSMELTLPKLGPLFKNHVQESLPRTDPLVTLKVPVIGHEIHDQKFKQGDPENMKASNGRFLNQNDVDSSKPPVVELLGEFMFANSSRETSIKRSNQNAEDATEEQEKSVKREKTDATPTPLTPTPVRRSNAMPTPVRRSNVTPTPLTPTPVRRSSRLRNKVTSP